MASSMMITRKASLPANSNQELNSDLSKIPRWIACSLLPLFTSLANTPLANSLYCFKLFYACIVGSVYKVKEDEEEEWWRMLSDSCNKICKMMSLEADKYSVEL